MYRINVYPEHGLKRKKARQRLLRMVLLSALLGLEAVLIGSLALSASLLGEQVATGRQASQRLNTHLRDVDDMKHEVAIAQQLLKLRSQRIDWSPKLAALAQGIDPSLRLIELSGQAPGEKRPARLEMGGEIRQQAAHLEEVSHFIEVLRADPRLADDFTGIRLGTLKGGTSDRFRVICTRQGEARDGQG